ncbi:hypothetical protein Y1Q_0013311 [Alligator mississippiensis]|uniref:Reverse transcriptase zinc-binding domain-containing protein n=1 Tax=Alligator mississippiensis TaxID=8496 RepID=A0A151NTN7_ALLMI|nr:hypothetical protein Y1Q_0013311 [Alligator mississippiensis]
MQVYEVVVGAKLNVSNRTCLAVDELGDLESPGSVSHEWVRILRIDFDPELSGRTVGEKTEAKVKQKLGLWHMHSLSMGGHIMIVKVVLLSVLLYTPLVFPPSKRVTHRIQRAMCIFFWGFRWEKVAWKTLYKDRRAGGRGMPDILLFLWAKYTSLICKLLMDAESKTACLVRYFAEHILGHWAVFTPTNHGLWIYETLNQCCRAYSL